MFTSEIHAVETSFLTCWPSGCRKRCWRRRRFLLCGLWRSHEVSSWSCSSSQAQCSPRATWRSCPGQAEHVLVKSMLSSIQISYFLKVCWLRLAFLQMSVFALGTRQILFNKIGSEVLNTSFLCSHAQSEKRNQWSTKILEIFNNWRKWVYQDKDFHCITPA